LQSRRRAGGDLDQWITGRRQHGCRLDRKWQMPEPLASFGAVLSNPDWNAVMILPSPHVIKAALPSGSLLPQCDFSLRSGTGCRVAGLAGRCLLLGGIRRGRASPGCRLIVDFGYRPDNSYGGLWVILAANAPQRRLVRTRPPRQHMRAQAYNANFMSSREFGRL
jgi:hypothetical protein